MKKTAQAKQVFEWIRDIIFSCTDDFHFEAVDKLIILFEERYKDSKHLSMRCVDWLNYHRSCQWNEIHDILK